MAFGWVQHQKASQNTQHCYVYLSVYNDKAIFNKTECQRCQPTDL